MHSKFARVIIDRAIRRELDYAIPESLSARVGIGARVRVPFRDRRALATVVALLEETNAKGIREIEAVIGEGPTLSEPLLQLARWIASYYCCPIEAVMRSLLPQVIRRAEVGWKKQQFVEIGSIVTSERMEALRRRAPRQGENGNLVAGNPRNPDAKSHCHRPGAGNFSHPANGRAFQKPLRRIAGRRGGFTQPLVRRRTTR